MALAMSINKRHFVCDTFHNIYFRIADYINKVVGTRKIPEFKTGAVVMKLDVEVSFKKGEQFSKNICREERLPSWLTLYTVEHCSI